MIVKVVPLPGDGLKPVMMKVRGRQVVYFYKEETGMLYSPKITLKEVCPSRSIKMHFLKEDSIIIGRLDL